MIPGIQPPKLAPRNSRILFRVFGFVGIVSGSVFGGIAGWIAVSNWDLSRHGLRAESTIVEMRETEGDSGSTYAPVYQYADRAGVSHTVASSSSSSPPEYVVGQKVTVLYHATNPQGAEIESFSALWMLPIVFGVAAVFDFAMAVVFLLLSRKQRPPCLPPSR